MDEEGCVAHRPPKYRRKLDKKVDVSSSTSTQLCDLPDSILHDILSYLETKDVVRISVLSKRWQRVWESIPYLRFYENGFSGSSNFCKFVESTLTLHDMSSSVKEFSLACSLEDGSSGINRWITAVVKRNVEVLKLLIYRNEGAFVLPCCIFRSETLVHLELRMWAPLRIPGSTCLSKLKVLALQYVIFVDDDSTQKLLSCPTLEELRIEYCEWRHVKVMKIFAPKLLELSIFDDEYYYYDGDDGPCQVLINGGQIRSFMYRGNFNNEYCITATLSLLIKAEVKMVWGSVFRSLCATSAKNASKLLAGLSSVKILTLNYPLLEQLSCRDELLHSLPTFSKMTKLILDCHGDFSGEGASFFWTILERCPHVETLEFSGHGFSRRSTKYCYLVPDSVPICFRSNLKKIVVLRDFQATETNISYMEDFLKTATVLEELVVHYRRKYSYMMKAEELLERLTRVPKGSSGKCKISIMVSYGKNFMRQRVLSSAK